jgi:serine protease Do
MAIKNKGFLAGATIGVGLSAAAAIAAGAHFQPASAQGPGYGQSAGAIQPTAPPGVNAPTGAPASFADIVQRVAPAVVSIEVTTHLKQPQMMQIPGLPFAIPSPGQGQGDNGDNGDDDNGGDSGDQAAPTPPTRGGAHVTPHKAVPKGPEAMAAGSGFFISSDGYIVTNNHVIEDAETIKVTLSDQRELTARLVGRDPLSDLAVLKVDGGPFPFVSFETASKPRVGDWAIAIGNPYTLGGTVTAGIVSAENRPIGAQFVNYLQIDAPINRGNSGGPTFDVFGRVVGVNTAIFSESGGSVGIGFAIPADLAANVTHQLITTGHVTRGFLGVSIQSLTPDMAESQGLGDRRGAIVGEVTPGGPAAAAGVQVGDIILSVNGQPVKSSEDLSQVTANVAPGGAIVLEIVRGSRHLTLTARAGSRPAGLAASPDASGSGDENAAPGVSPAGVRVIGMSVTPLTDAARQQYNVPSGVHGGLVVTRVGSDSDAAHEGIRPGFVIQRANDHLVNAPADLVAAVAEARRQGRPSILLYIQADGKPAFVPVKLDSGDAQK